MATQNKYNVLIIGAGKIGALFDSPGSTAVLTHAHAFKKHPGFELAGFYDVDAVKARKAAKIWGAEALSIKDVRKGSFDIISIAVPDAHHYSAMRSVSTMSTKMVFLEKPVASNIREAREIKSIFQRKKIPVCLNYRRRFVPEFVRLREDIAKNRFGKYIAGSGYYGKGLMHNGSHMIDLLRYLISEVKGSFLISKSYDHFRNDPSVSAVLNLRGGENFTVQHIDPRHFTVFEMDLLFEKKRVRIIDSGFKIEISDVRKDPLYKGYFNIERSFVIGTSLDKALYYPVDNIYKNLRYGQKLFCTIDDGIKDIETCGSIIKGQVK